MNPLQRSDAAPAGPDWPAWVLWAAAPVAIALGAVAGMAIATYLPAPSAAEFHAESGTTAAASAPAAATDRPAGQPGQSGRAAQGVPAAGQTDQPPAPAAAKSTSPGASPVPSRTNPTPSLPVPSPATAAQPKVQPAPTNAAPESPSPEPARAESGAPVIRDLRDARAALADSYSTYKSGGIAIMGIDYQPMRNAGLATSLVGLLPVRSYESWARAVREEPERLKAWLEEAVARVRPAIDRDRFFISWAVVEVLTQRPAGFADHEVTALANGAFLVVRPLASTMDVRQNTVSIRSYDSLQASVTGGRPTALSGPWAAYGPVVRFDPTDLYRPAGAGTSRPR